MNLTKIGFALCGSFCTFSKAIPQMEILSSQGFDIVPIMSKTAYETDTRFGNASDIVRKIENICNKKVIHTIKDAEPIGPKNLTDVMVVAPCTGNTLSKIANAITDTSVTMAVKSHLRCLRPVIIALATNDALSASAKNLGFVLNTKFMYFVPMSQDDPIGKPNSLVAHFDLIPDTIESALNGKQLQPVFYN